MKCIGPARGAMRSEYSYSNVVPSSTTLTYEGIFNSTYFELNSKETQKSMNMEISLASVKNPISNEKEIWLGTLLKSKHDGQKINNSIDISIALDISGSMSGERINMAKKSLTQLIQKLKDDDNIAISTFNTNSYTIFEYQSVLNLKKSDYTSKIAVLKDDGGTNIFEAFVGAYNLMSGEKCKKNKIRRIVIITDMEDSIDENLSKFCKSISEEGIYITILGISDHFRTDLAEMTSHIKGANYVVIKNIKDIQKYLVEDFEYLCFPDATNITLKVTTPYIKIKRIIGSGKEGVKEDMDKSHWNLERHKFYSDDFKEKIFFLLLYFKRKNRVLPKPVILTLSEFMVPGVKTEICNILTSFPSQIKTLQGNKIFVEGGMILLKLDNSTIRKENIMKFDIDYYDELENKKDNINVEYSFKRENTEKDNYFSDSKIETALGLFYFAKYNRRFMKICNMENKKKKYDEKYIRRKEFKTEMNHLEQFVKKHCIKDKNEGDNLNKDIISEYLEKMEKNVDKAIQYCSKLKKNAKKSLLNYYY